MSVQVGLHFGDVGTAVRLDTGVDISAATEVKIKYVKPDNSTGEWTGTVVSISGTQSGVQYLTQAGDLDQIGTWVFRAYVVMPTWTGHGARVESEVYAI